MSIVGRQSSIVGSMYIWIQQWFSYERTSEQERIASVTKAKIVIVVCVKRDLGTPLIPPKHYQCARYWPPKMGTSIEFLNPPPSVYDRSWRRLNDAR
jgi:hypothetical protein